FFKSHLWGPRPARQTVAPTTVPSPPPSAPPRHAPPRGAVPQDTAPTSPGPAPRRRRTLLLLPAAAVAVAGAIALTQLPGTGSHDSGATDPTTGPATTSPSAGSTASPTAARTAATTDLLTPQGIRTAAAAFEKQTGRDRFGKLAVYPDYVIAWVMVKGSDTAYDMYTYRPGQGVQKDIIEGALPGNETPVRLDGFDWDKVPSLLAQARQQLKVPHPTSRYLLVDLPGNAFGDPAGMSVYLGNEHGQSGYLQTDAKGKVVRVMPYDG
ncbi:serine/threonine protein kinase, partial [Streptomyces sp. NPDC059627]